MQKVITDDLDALLDVLPPHIRQAILEQSDHDSLLEVILDLGRFPEARFFGHELILEQREVIPSDIEYVTSRIGHFSGDNRAGIERTLHRISAILNREGHIIGLTCRVGRAVFGTVNIIQDLVETGKSVLLLGRPGIGKTTMLREVARVLADDYRKRVIVVDTSNEIAGDGDIPHRAIGHARRMQVPMPTMQHAVMIEAVENHMPQAIIIDEIGTELEAEAARTIAERGVQLVGTAHGNSLENLMMNPTLSDLIGGIQTVTLGDEEARRRQTQKSILERKAPPTFDIVVEIQERDKVVIHPDVGESVDAILVGRPQNCELRWVDSSGEIKREAAVVAPPKDTRTKKGKAPLEPRLSALRIYLFGINRPKLEEAAREKKIAVQIVDDLKESNLLLTTKPYYRRKPQKIRDAEANGIPIYAIKGNTVAQLRRFLDTVGGQTEVNKRGPVEDQIEQVPDMPDIPSREYNAQNAYIRRLQHILAGRNKADS